MSKRAKNKTRVQIVKVAKSQRKARQDYVVTEEPLEFRLVAGGEQRTVAVTMRTPGNDFELAAGFLFAEGIVGGRDEVARITYCVDRDVSEEQRYNIVNIELKTDKMPDLATLERNFYTTSACGLCGKASLDALERRDLCVLKSDIAVSAELLSSLPQTLRKSQGLFDITGGLHAAALFSLEGELVALREDVGRHNALDKLIGWALLENKLPLLNHILLLSGRASFELMQKALAAQIALVCAVSAPSSLAVDLARRFNMTLVGFLRDERFNIYAGESRVLDAEVKT